MTGGECVQYFEEFHNVRNSRGLDSSVVLRDNNLFGEMSVVYCLSLSKWF